MKSFAAMSLHQVRVSMRNRVALIFTLGLAFLFMVIFGFLFGGNSVSLKLDIVDQDQSTVSAQYISILGGAVNGVTVTKTDIDTAAADLKNGNIAAYLVVPKGFGDAVCAQRGAAGCTGGAQARAVVAVHQGSETASTTAIADSVITQVTEGFARGTREQPVRVATQTDSVNTITAIDYFLPAMIAYIILQSGINYVAIGLAELRVRKVLRRFRATPVKPFTIIASQVVAGILTVLLQLVVLVAVGTFLFGAKSYGSWFVVLVPILLGTAAFVGIGFLLTSAARTSESARALATMVAFPMMFLSGVFFPVTALPAWLATVVHVLPLTWLVDALHQVMNDGAGLGPIALDCLILIAWAVVTYALAVWRFRWE